MTRPALVALAALLALSACAGPVTQGPRIDQGAIAQETDFQQQLVFERAMKDEARVYSLAFPLLGANADFCGTDIRPVVGMAVWNISSIGLPYRAAAQTLYGLDDRLIIKTIARKSPAQKAGLLSGDIIESINGKKISGSSAPRAFDRAVDNAKDGQITFGIRRNGAALTVTLTPISACAYRVRIDHDSSEINAHADGKQIIITRGIIRFAENDEELALVIAHELAHNALTHISKLKQNALAGTLGGLLIDGLFAAGGISTKGEFAEIGADIGARQNNVAFEQEADYVGMYFMERAGYSAAHVAPFWRRMAAESSSNITQRTSHPTSPERFLAIEATYHEIKRKKATGQPLIPFSGKAN